jgi:hypothetical protein
VIARFVDICGIVDITIVAIFNGFKFQISRLEGFKKYDSYSYLKVK